MTNNVKLLALPAVGAVGTNTIQAKPVVSMVEVNYKDPSLNIIATLSLSPSMIKNKGVLYHNIISNISIKRNDELNLTDDNLKFIFFRLFCFGYNNYNINIISKNTLKKLSIVTIDINDLLKKANQNITTDTKYQVAYLDIKHMLKEDYLKQSLNDNIPTVFIFENISYPELGFYFRSVKYIISGGKISERHIMTNHRYELAIFLKAINNINKPSDSNNLYYSSSNLLKLYRYNTKTLMKFLTINVNLLDKAFTDDKLADFIKQFYYKYDVSKELTLELEHYNQNKTLINLLYRKIVTLIKDQTLHISKKEISLFIIRINDKNNIDNNQHILLFEFINNILYTDDNNININDLLNLIDLINHFNKTKILKLDNIL
jgi:hypothetical protein